MTTASTLHAKGQPLERKSGFPYFTRLSRQLPPGTIPKPNTYSFKKLSKRTIEQRNLLALVTS